MNPDTALNNGIVNLIGTATAFGQGAIASAISGNPYYSNDPAAANYATASTLGYVNTNTNPLGTLGIILLGAAAYLIFKK